MGTPIDDRADEHRALILEASKSNLVVLRLRWPLRAPLGTIWKDVTNRFVEAAFLGRSACFVTPDPQLGWGDTSLEELGLPVSHSMYQGYSYKSAMTPNTTLAALSLVAQSTDFRHGAFWIASASAAVDAPCRRFVRLLHAVLTLYPDADRWSRLAPQEVIALFERIENAKINSQHEFMECDDDWEGVYWYHPNPERLARAKEALRVLAAERGWAIEMD